MTTASISELKNELNGLSPERLAALCLQLAKFKKDNKELLSYLLFHDHELSTYIDEVKNEMDALFSDVNAKHLYFAKKTLRKILRITGKHIRYTSSKQAEAELLIHFCMQMKKIVPGYDSSTVLANLYRAQLKKIDTAIAGFHEDLQYDFKKQLKGLES